MLFRWLLCLSAAYLLMTLALAGLQMLFPAQGAGWLLVAIFIVPIWLAGEAAGMVVEKFLLTPDFVVRRGRKTSLVILTLVVCGLIFLSWFTLQQFKS